jgi:hypothetical protein
VHHVLAQRRGASGATRRTFALVALFAAIAALGLHDATGWLAIALAVPAALVVIHPPRATRLRAVGVGFLVCSVAAAALAVTEVRLAPHHDEQTARP